MSASTKTQVMLPLSIPRLPVIRDGDNLMPMQALQVGILNNLGSEIIRLARQIKMFRTELQLFNSLKQQARQIAPKPSQELSRIMKAARSPVD